MNLVFDLDDTLLNTYPLMVAALNNHTGKDYPPHTLSTYNLPELYSIPQRKVQEVIVQAKILERVDWLENPTIFGQAAERWVSEGHQVVFCTARAWHPNAEQVSRKTLDGAGTFPYQLVIVNHGDGAVKAQALNACNIQPHVFVDDNYSQVVGAHRAGATSWLYRQRHNYLHIWGNSVHDHAGLIAAVDTSIAARLGG